MFKRLSFAHYLLAGGAALGLLGLVLWRMLPIAMSCPPFLLTPVLALGYGGYELWRNRSPRDS
jgi:hypothetical protein